MATQKKGKNLTKGKKQNISAFSSITKISNIKDVFKGETLNFLIGLMMLFFAIFMIIAFISYLQTAANDQSILETAVSETGEVNPKDIQNQTGYLGAFIAHFLINGCFGLSAFFIPLFLIFASMRLMKTYKVHLWRKFLNFAFLMIWLSVVLTFFMPDTILKECAYLPGGAHGRNICTYLETYIGNFGILIIILVTTLFYLVYLSRRTIIFIRKILRLKDVVKLPKKNKDETPDSGDTGEEQENEPYEDSPIEIDLTDGNATKENNYIDNPKTETECAADATSSQDDNNIDLEFASTEEEEEADGYSLEDPYDPKLDLELYKYPTLNLLNKYSDTGKQYDMEEQMDNQKRITSILHNFGVEISSIKATVGPTITLYEITPAEGVRISKIKNLEDDIALSLSAIGIRIIAPIPGKGTIGIEVPNKNPKTVSIESILNSKKFQETTFDLPIALGKTITNEVYMVDLAKMPHLLVAGATGQGKSVGLNTIITSLIYKKHPSELKFVLIDPKKVEFSIYSALEKHFLAKIPDDGCDPIITDVSKVVQTLKSLCLEMDNRYLLLKKARCRNIKEYNQKFIERHLNPENGHRYLPYIVVIIDEFGDLIMTAGKEVELPIARIAQLARAVGIHMVIATQRPTTNIITGTIKANFPARMAFRVLAQIDSRTILDQGGANQLIGKGDMLMLAGGSLPTRVQCAFIDTPEVEKINNFIAEQQSYLRAYELPEVPTDEGGSSSMEADPNEKLDPLFEEAARLIVVHQQGSASLVQRKLAIGYNRAGRLMDQLERMGIVGPVNGSKPRDVLCADENSLQAKIDAINLQR